MKTERDATVFVKEQEKQKYGKKETNKQADAAFIDGGAATCRNG